VAVVTPASVAQDGTQYVETQYGCVAVDFSLTNAQNAPLGTGQPFTDVVATLTDADAQQAPTPSENLGANGCTYDPTSNTGVLIVRKLVFNDVPAGISIFIASLIGTGLMP